MKKKHRFCCALRGQIIRFHSVSGDSASLFFFFHLPPASFSVSRDQSSKRQLELQPAKKTSTKNKDRFSVLVIFSWVWCVFLWVEMLAVLWAMSLVFVFYISGPHLKKNTKKTPTVYQDCTSQDHRCHTCSISCASILQAVGISYHNIHSWPRGPKAGLYRLRLWGRPARFSQREREIDR